MSSAEVTPVEIARLAGVGRAAVSNWRRRYDDFPQPVGGTTTSPRFALAEVAAWLRRQGKVAELPAGELAWQEIRAGASDLDLPEAVRRAGELLLGGTPPAGSALAELAGEHGTATAFELLLRRLHEAARLPRIPDELADLMGALLGPEPATVYDPACGTGRLLLAAHVRYPRARLYGDEPDPALRELARLRATAHGAGAASEFGAGGLRHAPDPPRGADAVLCAPPPADRDWAGDDLTYDPRWQYGVPPKLEPELAWVQHALANLRPGGQAVLLLPPAVAARPSGRRIRAELLRRGALRAVIALPPGTAPPHNLGLHLWVLRRPPPGQPGEQVLVADLTAHQSGWPADPAALTTAVTTMDASSLVAAARVFRVMDLLDDAVDLSPGRRVRIEPEPVDGASVVRLRDQLREQLDQLASLLPAFDAAPVSARLPMIAVSDLARSGALSISVHNVHPEEAEVGAGAGDTVPLWRARDVVAGHGPGARLPADQLPADAIRLVAGDVVAPVIGHRLLARVVTAAEAGAVLGPNLYLLRPDPAMLDPWFLAGFLRRDTNTHRAGSLGSIHRYDIRRAQVPRVPVDEQRRYGAVFRRLAEFDGLLRAATDSGDTVMRLVADGLAAGTLTPQ